jgi:tetratricopeptide (TPR) repeat protein
VREALAIRERLLTTGRMPRDFERYAARSYANLGRVRAAAGEAEPAEQSYRENMKRLDQLAKEFPQRPLYRTDLAATMTSLAELLERSNRKPEAEAIRRRVVSRYESLTADFPEIAVYRHDLVQSYVLLARVRWELGRYGDAVDLYRKALTLAVTGKPRPKHRPPNTVEGGK